MGFAASFINFGSRVSYLQIYKVGNGVATELSKTNASTFGATELSEGNSNLFYINNTLYFPTSASSSLRVYKSDNFGKIWTNITNQITNTDGSAKTILTDFDVRTITMNNIVYFLKGKIIYSFNGEEIKKAIVLEKDITTSATIMEPLRCDRNDCSTRMILTNEQLKHGKYLYRCYDLKENSLMQNEEVISKEFVTTSNFFIKEKPFSIIYRRDSEELREFPVKAYIEDREKG